MTLHLSKVFFLIHPAQFWLLYVKELWLECQQCFGLIEAGPIALHFGNEHHLDVSKHFSTPLSVDSGEAAAFVMSEHFWNHILCEGGAFIILQKWAYYTTGEEDRTSLTSYLFFLLSVSFPTRTVQQLSNDTLRLSCKCVSTISH